jgi:hypothetical protein
MRLLKAQADAALIEPAKAQGEFVEAAAVEREWTAILGAVRAAMLAVPARVGATPGSGISPWPTWRRSMPRSARRSPRSARTGLIYGSLSQPVEKPCGFVGTCESRHRERGRNRPFPGSSGRRPDREP